MILIIKHVEYEGAGTIEEFFRKKKFPIRIAELYNGDVLPKDFKDIDAVISMGGPMSVDEEDKYPFLKDEDIFLKKVLKEEIPFLGVCLGSQLIAKAAGAKVTQNPVKEIGWFDIELTGDGKKDDLFRGLNGKFEVFQWHGDTFEIPPNGKHLALSKDCRHQALKVGRAAYGLQFHIEVTKDIISLWVYNDFKDKAGQVKPEGKSMIEHYPKAEKLFNTRAEMMYENFLKIIRLRPVSAKGRKGGATPPACRLLSADRAGRDSARQVSKTGHVWAPRAGAPCPPVKFFPRHRA